MIPQAANISLPLVYEKEQPTRTYNVDFERGRITGMTDGIEAMRQAVYLILNTERFRHLIYSWNYGCELSGVVGKDIGLAKSEISRLVTEALLQDERIISVDNFLFSQHERNKLVVSCEVTTSVGDVIKAQTEVDI